MTARRTPQPPPPRYRRVARRAPQTPGWKAPLLVVAAEGSQTMVAAGIVQAGVWTWRLPTLPAER